jgi:hypothetical protein
MATAMGSPVQRTVPVVDPDRITETYTELKTMQVKLDSNPIEYGPKRFNNRIAQVRALLNRVDQIFLQTSEDLHYFQRIINAKRTLYDLEKRDLLINDPHCRRGRNRKECEDLADIQLRDELEALSKLELAAQDLETLMVSIKSKRTDLKDAQGRMRDQMKLIEHDLSMGARWGSSAPITTTAETVAEINSLLVDVDPDFDSEEDEETTDEETTDEETTDEAKEDPAPHAEPEPVLTFGEEAAEEEESESTVAEDDGLIPDEDSEGSLPENESAKADVDDFLDALGSVDKDDETETQGSEDGGDAGGIDDLIASLADD